MALRALTLSSCHPITLSPYHPITLSSCHPITLSGVWPTTPASVGLCSNPSTSLLAFTTTAHPRGSDRELASRLPTRPTLQSPSCCMTSMAAASQPCMLELAIPTRDGDSFAPCATCIHAGPVTAVVNGAPRETPC